MKPLIAVLLMAPLLCGAAPGADAREAALAYEVVRANVTGTPVASGQIGAVAVSWEHAGNLLRLDVEARALGLVMMQELKQRGLAHADAGHTLLVRITKVQLHGIAQMDAGTNTLYASIHYRDAEQQEVLHYPLRVARSYSARASKSMQEKLLELYRRFAVQALDELEQRLAGGADAG